MSQIETTSRVPSRLVSKINLGRQGTHGYLAFDFRHSLQTPRQSGKSYTKVKNDPTS